MKTYEYVKEISDYYAYWDFAEFEEIDVDYQATAHAVWRWLNKENILARIRKFTDKWMQKEYLHLSIQDYFSMFEPIEKPVLERSHND